MKSRNRPALKSRQNIGKYQIDRLLARGGFADVYRARDTVEGVRVALKIPHLHMMANKARDELLKEVRLTARLDHANILPIKNATFAGDQLLIAYALGEGTLGDRFERRLSLREALNFTEQMIEGVAYAHQKRIIHCDIKPDNFIVFPGDRVRLSDFGIARLTTHWTMSASGSGTIGFVAPEQAMGHPSLRSDVFSLSLVIFRMITGYLPSWPFDWPLPGTDVLRRKTRSEFVALLRRGLEVDARKRFPTAVQMLDAFKPIRSRIENPTAARRRRKRRQARTNGAPVWREVQIKDFKRNHARTLEATHSCTKCDGPISEAMQCCPWCGHSTQSFRHETRFPARCRSCRRGMKLDWKFCAHCYGAAQGPRSDRHFSDRRYASACTSCTGDLMPFMSYCPWCRTKVKRAWKIEGTGNRCPKCRWGVLRDHWDHCPWCRTRLKK